MTDREKAIVMAYTGRCMLTGDKFQIYHKYVEDILGRPVWTHEIGSLADEIKEKSKADFIALCADESSSEKVELKPCPFCGSEAEITKENHTDDGYSIHVGCSKCFCKIKKNLWFDFNESAIQYSIAIMTKEWNTRVESEVEK